MMLAPFAPEEYASRRERLQAELARRGLDGVLLTELANFEYVTGFQIRVIWSSFTRYLAVFVPVSGRPVLLVPGFVAQEAAEASGYEVRTYDRIDHWPLDELRRLIADGRRGNGPVGAELGGETRLGVAVEALNGLGVEFVDASDTIWAVRIRKSPAEVERLARASEANAVAFGQVFGRSLAGMTEAAVARDLEREALAAGAGWSGWTQPGWIAITSGIGHYHRFLGHPRPRPIEAGDMVWADLGMTVDGYWSDYCRAAVLGGPTAQQGDRQARILEATSAGVDTARPGRRASEVAIAVDDACRRLGLPSFGFGRVGHGIGLTATEPPHVARHDDTVLEAGMVITVEPASVEDDGIYCAEQVVVVGEPPVVLSSAPGVLASV
jgi:Xaa-Pro aminopeptidase